MTQNLGKVTIHIPLQFVMQGRLIKMYMYTYVCMYVHTHL